MHEALELGRENHVHEQECQAKRDQEIRIRFLEALGLPDELPAVIRRQIERLDVVSQFGDSLSQGLALEVGRDDDLPLPRGTLANNVPRYYDAVYRDAPVRIAAMAAISLCAWAASATAQTAPKAAPAATAKAPFAPAVTSPPRPPRRI
jgi:hypothetical protein